jgi:hypothetical protein
MHARNDFFSGERAFAFIEESFVPKGESPPPALLRTQGWQRHVDFFIEFEISIRDLEFFPGKFADGGLIHRDIIDW